MADDTTPVPQPAAAPQPQQDPLDAAREALSKDAAVRGARCRALIDAALKETRHGLFSRFDLIDAGGGAITVRPLPPILVPE